MCGVDTKETYVEILYFKQFYRHFVFVEDEDGNRNKGIEKYFEVSAVGGYKKLTIVKNFKSCYLCNMRLHHFDFV